MKVYQFFSGGKLLTIVRAEGIDQAIEEAEEATKSDDITVTWDNVFGYDDDVEVEYTTKRAS